MWISYPFSTHPPESWHIASHMQRPEQEEQWTSVTASSCSCHWAGLPYNQLAVGRLLKTQQNRFWRQRIQSTEPTFSMSLLSIWVFSEWMEVLFRPVIFWTASLNRSAPSLQSTNTNTGGLKSFLSWGNKTRNYS